MPVPLAYVLGGGALAALAIYKFHPMTDTNPPAQPGKETSNFFDDWFDGGGQPKTGNGQNDVQGVAKAVESLAHFGDDLLNWWGKSSDSTGSSAAGGTSSDRDYSQNTATDWDIGAQ